MISDLDFYNRLETEGFGLPTGALGSTEIDYTGQYTSSNSTALASLKLSKPSRLWWIDSIQFTATQRLKCRLRIVDQTGYSYNGLSYNFTYPTQNQSVIIGPNPITIPVKRYIGYGSSILLQQYGVNTAPKLGGILDTPMDGVQFALTGTITGWDLTNDLNLGAAKTILGWGDSVTYGQGCSTNDGPYLVRLRDWYRNNGTDVRLVNMAYPGMTSYDLQLVQSQGLWQTKSPDLIIYTMGVNDIQSDGAGFSSQRQTWFSNAVASAIAYKKRNYPNAIMIVCGMTPIFKAIGSVQSDAALCRNLAASAVSTVADPKVFFCDLGSAFVNTDSSNYGDPGSTAKHPNEQGNLAIFNILSSFITTNNISI